jgi:DNA helicase-2/ATP-dependent DNA helicase PcrA
MTRAMDTLILTRARYRRRYGSDMPESSMASRFLEEVPSRLIEDLGSPGVGMGSAYGARRGHEDRERHYSYEDEDQSGPRPSSGLAATPYPGNRAGIGGKPGGSIDNIANFFAARGQKPTRPKLPVPEPTGKTGLHKGVRVRHPKYGEGMVFQREGDGDDAKITVQFQQHGVKKLVEKFAQLQIL